ncbi:MAG: helix-turn-helix transcriptional regulator [Rhodothermales bacterium]|nr:helix-turn-helix transcriptional regulator [Rhodothermales bacterium]MBO6779373.1 helix-turn-helix transcriptional regulator [Rhodothermales bacterium]
MKQLTRSDETFLVAIHCLGDDAFSTSILDELKRRVGKKVTVGSLWVSLDSLADRGYLRKNPRPGASVGRPRVYYALTPKGRRALIRARENHEQLWADVPALR